MKRISSVLPNFYHIHRVCSPHAETCEIECRQAFRSLSKVCSIFCTVHSGTLSPSWCVLLQFRNCCLVHITERFAMRKAHLLYCPCFLIRSPSVMYPRVQRRSQLVPSASVRSEHEQNGGAKSSAVIQSR